LIWAATRFSTRAISGRIRVLTVAVRSLAVAAIVLALARPVLTRLSADTAVVYVVDASDSVSTAALESAADAIDEMNGALQPDEVRLLVFGARPAPLADTAALRRLAASNARPTLEALIDPSQSNIEQALVAARGEIPPGANGRIVLFSDGRETEGVSRRSAERLAADRVSIFTRPLVVRDIADTWIGRVTLPRTPVADAPTTIEILVGSQVSRPVDLVVKEGAAIVGRASAVVQPGTTPVGVDVAFRSAGPHVVEATVAAEGDPLAVNDRYVAEVVVEPRPRVLYVHGGNLETGLVPATLIRGGLDVTRIAPSALPASASTFDRWDVVVLSNVARTAITDAAMAALATWVEERGGGLLFVGGSAVVGEGPSRTEPGYRESEIERILPVTFEREDEPEVALVIVLDRSWSMSGLPMELSKAAAEAAVNTLASTQMVGVLTFNNEWNWDLPLARLRENRDNVHEAIARIMASGPTAIFPALEQAYARLAAVRARAKHVILLSDGQTAAADFEGLVKNMAKARITVSSVAFGPDADVGLLGSVAKWGGGRSYVVQDARQIPEIFVKEAKGASTPGFEEEPAIRPVLRQTAWIAGASGTIPALAGRNVVTRKPQAIDLVSTDRGEPILAIWPAGLGRTAMLATDVDGAWGRGWASWRGFGAFLPALARTLAPRRLPARELTLVKGDRQGDERLLTIALEARDADGRRENGLRPNVAVRAGANQAAVDLSPTASGRYEATIAVDTSEPLAVSLPDANGAVGSARVVVEDAYAEYRFGEPDVGLLESLARTTGGVMNPTPADLRGAPAGGRPLRAPLAPWLLGLALVLWLADIGVRRLPARRVALRQ
jgi:Mg-chelatase subunit ChlD